jgi:cold shock CspA family protein
MAQGTIVRLSESGFGLIAYGARYNLYFPRSAVLNTPFDTLRPGDRVEFVLEKDPRGGGLRAVNVRRLGATAPEDLGNPGMSTDS